MISKAPGALAQGGPAGGGIKLAYTPARKDRNDVRRAQRAENKEIALKKECLRNKQACTLMSRLCCWAEALQEHARVGGSSSEILLVHLAVWLGGS